MAVRRNSGRTDPTRTLRRLFERLSRYDLTLAVLPVGFLLSWMAHFLASISFQLATAVGALFGLVVLADALFVHPPSEKPPRTH